jgi:hypothetical protein
MQWHLSLEYFILNFTIIALNRWGRLQSADMFPLLVGHKVSTTAWTHD